MDIVIALIISVISTALNIYCEVSNGGRKEDQSSRQVEQKGRFDVEIIQTQGNACKGICQDMRQGRSGPSRTA